MIDLPADLLVSLAAVAFDGSVGIGGMLLGIMAVAAAIGGYKNPKGEVSTAPSHATAHFPTELLDHIDGGVLVIDSTYRIEHFNQQASVFFPHQTVEVGAVLPHAFIRGLPETQTNVTLAWPPEQGTIIRVHIGALRKSTGVYRVLTLRDITETVQIRMGLERTDSLLRAILNTDVAAVAVTNEYGDITYANERAESILGLQRSKGDGENESIVGEAWTYDQLGWTLESLDEETSTRTPLRDVLDTGEPIRDMRCAITWPNGERRYLSLNAAPLQKGRLQDPQVVFAVTDITERYQMQQRLLQKLQVQEATHNAMPALLYMSDYAGSDRHWNESLKDLTGYTEQELQGRALPYLFHPDDRLRIRKAIHTVFAAQETFGFVVRLQAKDGRLRPCMLNGALGTVNGADYLMVVGLDLSGQGVS